MAKRIKHKREYKDRLFKLIFREKQDLLELYNAINGTSYQNPDDIEINTLEDVVYLGMKNDLSFLIKDVLNLFEHQSTYSPNLPLRGFFYFSDLYRKIVGTQKDIYSSKRIILPIPQFIIFYNGTENEPERQLLALSDSFQKANTNHTPCLECTAVMLNINLGKNKKLMAKCRKLYEYAQLIAYIRQNLTAGQPIDTAIDNAVVFCINQNILKNILLAHREEVTDMLLTEYDEELHIRSEREIAKSEGEEVGLQKGTTRINRLNQLLIEQNRIDDMLKATTDSNFQEMLLEEFEL